MLPCSTGVPGRKASQTLLPGPKPYLRGKDETPGPVLARLQLKPKCVFKCSAKLDTRSCKGKRSWGLIFDEVVMRLQLTAFFTWQMLSNQAPPL